MIEKKTILQVLPALNGGGVERGTVDIARAIHEQGWTSLVASSGGKMESQIGAAGAAHITLPLACKNPFTIALNIYRLYRVIKQHGVDVIHARSRVPAWSAYFAARLANIPYITTFHGVYSFSSSLKRRYNSVMTYGVRVIAVSDFIKQHIVKNYGTDETKIHVIHRGVDTDTFSMEAIDTKKVEALRKAWDVPADTKVIFMPARITRWKGQAVLIEALAQLTCPYYCVIAGVADSHSQYKAELEDAIRRYGCEEKIRIVEAVSDMPEALSIADVVVSPSLRPEAFGRIPIEASAMETPVVATAHGGAMETVLEGKTGLLVPPHDSDALAEAIYDLLHGAWFDGAIARRHVEGEFSLKTMCKKTLAIYESVSIVE